MLTRSLTSSASLYIENPRESQRSVALRHKNSELLTRDLFKRLSRFPGAPPRPLPRLSMGGGLQGHLSPTIPVPLERRVCFNLKIDCLSQNQSYIILQQFVKTWYGTLSTLSSQ